MTLSMGFQYGGVVGRGYQVEGGRHLYPVIAPALIIIGCMMLGGARRIEWDESSEAIPSFLTISIIPYSMSITGGRA